MLELHEKFAALGLSGLAYTIAHELGHFATALLLGLQPRFVWGGANDNLLNFAFGIQYANTTLLQSFLVLMGATILPLMGLAFIFFMHKDRKSESLVIAAEVFLVLIIFSFLPIPNAPDADGSRIWAAILAGG